MRTDRTPHASRLNPRAVGRNASPCPVYATHWKAGPWRNERANRRPRRTTGRASS